MKKNSLYTLLMITLTAAIVVVAFLSYRALTIKKPPLEASGVYYSVSKSIIDPFLGRLFKPNLNVEVARVDNRKLTLTFNFKTDEYGRRVVPNNRESNEFLILYGCSFAFGFGLEDEETIASKLAAKQEKYKIYNYNSNAYGPTQLLAYLESKKMRNEVPQVSGILVYSFIADHFNRLYPSPSNFDPTPFYELKNGKLEHKGLITDVFPEKIEELEERARMTVEADPFTEAEKNHLCAVVKKSAQLFHKQFRDSRFILLINDWKKDEVTSFLKACVAGEDIELLDFSPIVDQGGMEFIIPIDEHPSLKWTEKLSSWLVEKL